MTPAGFTGETLTPVADVFSLGSEQRAYNPVLMRFTAPDLDSPFSGGGLNPYAYGQSSPSN